MSHPWADPPEPNPWQGWADVLTDPPLRFVLVRHEDETGVATEQGWKPGEVVAWGVRFPDGPTVIRWCVSGVRQTAVFASVEDVQAIHGHGGKTELCWLDGRSTLLDTLAPPQTEDETQAPTGAGRK